MLPSSVKAPAGQILVTRRLGNGNGHWYNGTPTLNLVTWLLYFAMRQRNQQWNQEHKCFQRVERWIFHHGREWSACFGLFFILFKLRPKINGCEEYEKENKEKVTVNNLTIKVSLQVYAHVFAHGREKVKKELKLSDCMRKLLLEVPIYWMWFAQRFLFVLGLFAFSPNFCPEINGCEEYYNKSMKEVTKYELTVNVCMQGLLCSWRRKSQSITKIEWYCMIKLSQEVPINWIWLAQELSIFESSTSYMQAYMHHFIWSSPTFIIINACTCVQYTYCICMWYILYIMCMFMQCTFINISALKFITMLNI